VQPRRGLNRCSRAAYDLGVDLDTAAGARERFDARVDALAAQGARLATVASEAGLEAAVPTCPGWTVRDVLAHVGGVHRWAAAHVAGARSEPLSSEERRAAFHAPPDGSLLDWYAAGHTALVAVLRDAGPERPCWSFLPGPTGSAFWARRQVHETAIHRADVESATGTRTSIDGWLAADGIDELVRGFFSRPQSRLRADPAVTLAIRCVDVPGEWTVRAGPDASSGSLGASAADCIVTALANDCYELLWNRRDAAGLAVDGDATVLDTWRSLARVD